MMSGYSSAVLLRKAKGVVTPDSSKELLWAKITNLRLEIQNLVSSAQRYNDELTRVMKINSDARKLLRTGGL